MPVTSAASSPPSHRRPRGRYAGPSRPTRRTIGTHGERSGVVRSQPGRRGVHPRHDPHHLQAVTMSNQAPARAASPEVEGPRSPHRAGTGPRDRADEPHARHLGRAPPTARTNGDVGHAPQRDGDARDDDRGTDATARITDWDRVRPSVPADDDRTPHGSGREWPGPRPDRARTHRPGNWQSPLPKPSSRRSPRCRPCSPGSDQGWSHGAGPRCPHLRRSAP